MLDVGSVVRLGAAERGQLLGDVAQLAIGPHVRYEQAGERAEAGQRSQFDDATGARRPRSDSVRNRPLGSAAGVV